jgi:protein tyrosine phosphatase (PTP) superfamily phosphohydrolase (DUF442 family)
MQKKKANLGWVWMIVIVLAIVGAVKHFHIKNFQVIESGKLYASGQPQGMDYTRLLYKYHIATFVNLRVVGEHREQNWYSEEVEWMKSNGANYVELPIDKNITIEELAKNESLQRFLALMDDKMNQPVLLHDSSGKHRVAMLVGAWMMKTGRFSLEDTFKKVEHLKKEPLEDKEKEFLKTFADSK